MFHFNCIGLLMITPGNYKKVTLLPTGSEERKVLEVGSIPVAKLPSCHYFKILHYNCTDINIVE